MTGKLISELDEYKSQVAVLQGEVERLRDANQGSPPSFSRSPNGKSYFETYFETGFKGFFYS